MTDPITEMHRTNCKVFGKLADANLHTMHDCAKLAGMPEAEDIGELIGTLNNLRHRIEHGQPEVGA